MPFCPHLHPSLVLLERISYPCSAATDVSCRENHTAYGSHWAEYENLRASFYRQISAKDLEGGLIVGETRVYGSCGKMDPS